MLRLLSLSLVWVSKDSPKYCDTRIYLFEQDCFRCFCHCVQWHNKICPFFFLEHLNSIIHVNYATRVIWRTSRQPCIIYTIDTKHLSLIVKKVFFFKENYKLHLATLWVGLILTSAWNVLWHSTFWFDFGMSHSWRRGRGDGRGIKISKTRVGNVKFWVV